MPALVSIIVNIIGWLLGKRKQWRNKTHVDSLSILDPCIIS